MRHRSTLDNAVKEREQTSKTHRKLLEIGKKEKRQTSEGGDSWTSALDLYVSTWKKNYIENTQRIVQSIDVSYAFDLFFLVHINRE